MIVPGESLVAEAVKESLLEEVGPGQVVRENGIMCEKIGPVRTTAWFLRKEPAEESGRSRSWRSTRSGKCGEDEF